MNIIFVCTGNTCRSPMAEGFLKQMITGVGVSDVSVSSRGIAASDNAPASRFSVVASSELGADISSHTSRMLSEDDIANADLIITMTSSHAELIRSTFTQYAHKVFPISQYVSCEEITDPYGGDIDTYRECAKQIYDAVQIVFSKISGNVQ